MISFWEQSTYLEDDIAIIGGGIVGLSVASSIIEKHPHRKITIYERSIVPFGASTRNAGFACFGSLTEVMSDMQTMGESQARDLLFQRWLGLQITRKRLGDDSIGFEENGGFELLPDTQALQQMQAVNDLVSDFIPNYISSADEMKAPLGIVHQGPLVSMREEGQVHAGLLMTSLEAYACQNGIRIRNGANVEHIEMLNGAAELHLKDEFRNTMKLRAQQVIVCNNAFVGDLYPDLGVVPGRGQVFITKPIDELSFAGNLHMDEGFYYLRNVGDRILFGGGRNLDVEGETTTEININHEIQHALEEKIESIFGADFNFEVDQRWSGIMAFGNGKQPIIQTTNDGALVAVKLSGMGIALAGYVGEEIGDQLNC